MALIVLFSASGSPGVTASALGLALTWSRPVLLVEGDPTGGSAVFAGYLRAESAPTNSLIDLALAQRHGQLSEAIAESTVRMPGPPDSAVSLLPGTRAHGQARSLLPLWETLAAELKALEATGQDVIVDAGRLGLAGSPEPLIYAADLALMVTRTDLVSLSAARSWAQTLRTEFEGVGGMSSLGLLLVGQGEPYSARDVQKVLQIPVIASLAQDVAGADVFAKGAKAPRRFDSSRLVRSLTAARTSIQSAVTTNRGQLAAQFVGGTA
ncbi:hypothetical protein SAMN04489867_3121 [Pedococcus dokdonensis]|uniref:Cellulose biosynthesis protein BcsQ n=1 Tax=Pedococcus dokdonensis TaxID=443156 RepID=A0A1H0U4J5_9MICO|nr:hypothetical protein [Pedococcus dokdonensis]SDP60888.1 hypothetical protein SAMN04489867_3121 [Pedococcus dokdonensis]